MIPTLFLAVTFFSIQSFATTNQHDLLADRFGVSKERLNQIYQPAVKSSDSKTCISFFATQPTNKSRDELLSCYLSNASELFSEKGISEIFNYQLQLYESAQNSEIEKSLRLNNLIMDLMRSKLAQSRPVSWLAAENDSWRFLNLASSQRDEFKYQVGDLVLAYGGNGTSGLVGETTTSVYRYSHAFVVGEDKSQLVAYETLPETGARRFPLSDIKKEKYSSMVVLRWKDSVQFEKLKDKMIENLNKKVEAKLPFDHSMSDQFPDKIYCTKMAAIAFSDSASLSLSEVFPDQTVYASSAVQEFAKDMGVVIPARMIHPRAILRSTFFKVVAEYRDTEKLFHTWQIEKLTQLSTGMYEKKQHIESAFFLKHIDLLFHIPFLDRIKIVGKSKKISEDIGFDQFAKLATFETKVVSDVVKKSNLNFENKKFHEVPLWELYQNLEKEFEFVKIYFQ